MDGTVFYKGGCKNDSLKLYYGQICNSTIIIFNVEKGQWKIFLMYNKRMTLNAAQNCSKYKKTFIQIIIKKKKMHLIYLPYIWIKNRLMTI